MNGYDAQDMAAQGADGFRNGYQAGYADAVKAIEAAQPAAAQEAVAWLSKDEAQLALFKAIQAIRFGNPTDDKMILDNLRHEGLWIGRYANAPVTAAPARVTVRVAGVGSATLEVVDGGIDLPLDTIMSIAARGTPAAPGIDLAELQAIASDLSHSAKVDDYEPHQIAFIESIRDRLLTLIDASPNGELESWKRGTKACAEVLGQVTRQLADSPKGGNDAEERP